MPRDEQSIFAWGMPSFQDAKESYLGTKPAMKIVNSDNEVTKKTDLPKPKKVIPRKKKDAVVKNYILTLLTKSDE
jgi:hypothetical protein